MALVPEQAPHFVRNVGAGTARVVGFFPDGRVTSEFDEAVQPYDERAFPPSDERSGE